MKPESRCYREAVALGIAFSLATGIGLVLAAAAALAGGVLRFASSTVWCGMMGLGALMAMAAFVVPPLGPYLAARRGGWRCGLLALAVVELLFVAVALAASADATRRGLDPAFVVGAGIVYAALYGALSALLVAYGGRSNSISLAGGPERSRRVYVRRQTPALSGRPRGKAPSIADFTNVVWVSALLPVFPLSVLTLLMTMSLTGSGSAVVVIALGAGLSVQAAVVVWLSLASFGGLEPRDVYDLAELGERHGRSAGHATAAFMAGVPLALISGIAFPLAGAVRVASVTDLEHAAGLVGVSVLSAMGLGAFLLRIESARLAPVEWMRRRTGAEWLAKGEHAGVKRALARASTALGLPYPPGMLVIDVPQVNAWVVGKPSHAAVGVTQGLLDVLSAEQLVGVFASLLARVACGGVATPAVASVLDAVRMVPSAVGGSLRYVQACDIRGVLAMRDVDVLEQAIASTLGRETTLPGVSAVFAAHLWLWPHGPTEVPNAELHRIELLRAVDPSRSTLQPRLSVRPSLVTVDDGPGLPAWVVCEKCSGANDVTLDRCRYCSASLG